MQTGIPKSHGFGSKIDTLSPQRPSIDSTVPCFSFLGGSESLRGFDGPGAKRSFRGSGNTGTLRLTGPMAAANYVSKKSMNRWEKDW